MLLDDYVRNLPWVIPTVLLGLLVLWWVSGRVADRVPRWLTVLSGLSVVGFVALVATPSYGTLTSEEAGSFVSTVRLPQVRDLVLFTETGLNVWITVPMGALAVLLAVRIKQGWPLLVAYLTPVLCESVQWALPQWGRVGFQVSDLLLNWAGVSVGAALAWLCGRRVAAVDPRG